MKDPIFVKDKEVFDASWPAHPVNVAESSSPMPGLSQKQEQEDFRILLDRLKSQDEVLVATYNMMTRIEVKLDKIIEALAEDQDPDEMPATYMDGSPVR